MTTNELLELDCRKKENREIIQKVLRKIKPLSKYSVECDVPFVAIEKAVRVMTQKYRIHIATIYPDTWCSDDGTVWKATVYNDETYKQLGNVFGLSMYELFAKCAICMYSEVRKGLNKR